MGALMVSGLLCGDLRLSLLFRRWIQDAENSDNRIAELPATAALPDGLVDNEMPLRALLELPQR
jgi:hypothetical protein